ncbi:hypothetical protein TorRG33x02_186560 [Trema orientale]|uniref:Uncharacterized protein n=1 Tax=Trema orientale TaxID=63057 RepID=A0A2P5EIY3_TREOI|nr:hypothetical protein TorRG33x02_186560 [Trema orientale]
MDGIREYQFIPFGICQRFFELVMEFLAAQAFKTVTLGQPRGNVSGMSSTYGHRPNGAVEPLSSQVVQPMVQQVPSECGVSVAEVDIEQANVLNSSGPFGPLDLQAIFIE